MQRCIYLVLTQTGSILSSAIKLFTRAEFNHISLSLSSDLDPMYSFGRKRPYNPFFGGFVKEYIYQGTFYRFPCTKCRVLKLSVTEAQYTKIQEILEIMYSAKHEYGYDLKGLLLAPLKVHCIRDKKFYCSEFVRWVLQKAGVSGAENLPNIVQPENFFQLPDIATIYHGLLCDYPVNSANENEKLKMLSKK